MLDSVRILKNVASQNSYEESGTFEIRADSYPLDFYIQLWQSDSELPYTPADSASLEIQFLRMDTVAAVPESQSQFIPASTPFADRSIWKVTLGQTNVQKIISGGFRVVLSDSIPSDVINIADAGTPGADRTSNIVTITTSSPHGLEKGQSVIVAGVSDSSFDGTFVIASVLSATTFTYSQTDVDQTSGGGTATLTPDPEFKRTLFSRMSIRKIPSSQSPLLPEV